MTTISPSMQHHHSDGLGQTETIREVSKIALLWTLVDFQKGSDYRVSGVGWMCIPAETY